MVFDEVPPDSSLAVVTQAAASYHEHGCDALTHAMEAFASSAPEQRGQRVLETARDLQEKLYALCRLPRTLEEAGASRNQLGIITRKAIDDGSLIFNPREVSFDDALELVKKAFAP